MMDLTLSTAGRTVRSVGSTPARSRRRAASARKPRAEPRAGLIRKGLRAMEISDLLRPEGVIANLRATSKKQALQELARKAAELTHEHERAIFDVLLERERLGTTGVGAGIAIPHG